MTSPSRDRSLPLTLPRVPRRSASLCAFCNRSCPGSHDRYRQRIYCSSECHKAARRADAIENAKKKQLRPLLTGAPTNLDQAIDRNCIRCGCALTIGNTYADKSRSWGRTNICRACEKAKFAQHYRANRERLRQSSRTRNRQARASEPMAVPPGIALSPRQLRRCTDNLQQIVAALPDGGAECLIENLHRGHINGAVFEDRAGCGCLWGVLGRRFGWSVAEEGWWAARFRQRWCAEVDLFGHIAPGDTPQSNPYARTAYETIIAASQQRQDAPEKDQK